MRRWRLDLTPCSLCCLLVALDAKFLEQMPVGGPNFACSALVAFLRSSRELCCSMGSEFTEWGCRSSAADHLAHPDVYRARAQEFHLDFDWSRSPDIYSVVNLMTDCVSCLAPWGIHSSYHWGLSWLSALQPRVSQKACPLSFSRSCHWLGPAIDKVHLLDHH